jgi:hypothetical protein
MRREGANLLRAAVRYRVDRSKITARDCFTWIEGDLAHSAIKRIVGGLLWLAKTKNAFEMNGK